MDGSDLERAKGHSAGLATMVILLAHLMSRKVTDENML